MNCHPAVHPQIEWAERLEHAPDDGRAVGGVANSVRVDEDVHLVVYEVGHVVQVPSEHDLVRLRVRVGVSVTI